jgi:hypothetical protein
MDSFVKVSRTRVAVHRTSGLYWTEPRQDLAPPRSGRYSGMNRPLCIVSVRSGAQLGELLQIDPLTALSSLVPFVSFAGKVLRRACANVLKFSPVFSIEEAQSLADSG